MDRTIVPRSQINNGNTSYNTTSSRARVVSNNQSSNLHNSAVQLG